MKRFERFVDTGYWLALAVSSDVYHGRAVRLAATLRSGLITTEAILLEVGNTLARARFRPLGIQVIADIRADPGVEIVAVTSELLARAIDLYAARPDKEWGLTDCVSFVVMQQRGIHEALAADQHFVQAGFRALLRE